MRRTIAAIALVLGVLGLASTAGAASPRFGIHTPGDPYGGNVDRVDGLERDLGRRVAVVSWYQSWGGDPWARDVKRHVFGAVLASRRLALVTWEPWVPGAGATQPAFSLRRINGGAFDGYIASWARALRDLARVVYLRPMHEMNGDWYPWAGTVNGNSPRRFRAAWRRIHRIFRSHGARNVRFVFSPINESVPGTRSNRLERYYPGRRYVDVLAMDGYNWGAQFPHFGGWRSFRATFGPAYRRLRKLGRQPIWIAEVGSSAVGGDKAAWVHDMFATARRWRRLRAIVWMDTNNPGEGDWRARVPHGTAAAFRIEP